MGEFKISLVEPTTSSSRGERSTTLLLPVGENDLKLKNESIVGRVDHSGSNLEALGRDVGRRRDGRRHVDADVVDPAEAASTVAVLTKIAFSLLILQTAFLFLHGNGYPC